MVSQLLRMQPVGNFDLFVILQRGVSELPKHDLKSSGESREMTVLGVR